MTLQLIPKHPEALRTLRRRLTIGTKATRAKHVALVLRIQSASAHEDELERRRRKLIEHEQTLRGNAVTSGATIERELRSADRPGGSRPTTFDWALLSSTSRYVDRCERLSTELEPFIVELCTQLRTASEYRATLVRELRALDHRLKQMSNRTRLIRHVARRGSDLASDMSDELQARAGRGL